MRDPKQLDDAEHSEDSGENAGSIAAAQYGAVPAWEFRAQDQNQRSPDRSQQEQKSRVRNEQTDCLRPVKEIGRNNDGDRQLQPDVVARALKRQKHAEDKQAENKNVRDLRRDQAANRKCLVQADVISAAKQVAVVHDEDNRREADGLAEFLEQGGPTGGSK